MSVVQKGSYRRKMERDAGLLRRGWRPISEYRKEMGYVVVIGDSGYNSTPYQAAIAIMDEEYRPHDPWVDHSGEQLSSSGLVPGFFSTALPNED
jgi:hypothetical protein